MQTYFKNKTYFFFQNKKYLYILTLLIIIIAGLFLRLMHIGTHTMWIGDTSRDILVAKHMVENNESLFISPYAGGGNNILNNSPFYYWMLSSFWLISPSANGVIIIFTILSSSIIILSFFISKTYAKGYSVFLFPFFVSISSFFIALSKSVWQPNLLPFFQLISIFFFIKAYKKNKLYYILSIQFAFLATHLHLSYLPLLLSTILLSIFYLVKKSNLKELILTIFISFGNIAFWLQLSDTKLLSNKQNSINIIEAKSLYNIVFNTINNGTEITNVLFTDNTFIFPISFLILLIVLLLISVIILKRNNVIKHICIMLLAMMSSSLLLSQYSNIVHYHYLIPYGVILLLSISVIISSFRNKIFSTISAVIVTTLLINGNGYWIHKGTNQMYSSEKIATIISKTTKSNNVLIKICTKNNSNCTDLDLYENSIIYYLEEITQEKYGYISNDPYSNFITYSSLSSSEKNVFFLCFGDNEKCNKPFIKENPSLIYSEDDLFLYHFNQILQQ